MCPIDGDVFAQADQQFMCDHSQLIVAHHLQRGFVLGKGVVESDLFFGKSLFLTAGTRGAGIRHGLTADDLMVRSRRSVSERDEPFGGEHYLQPAGAFL